MFTSKLVTPQRTVTFHFANHNTVKNSLQKPLVLEHAWLSLGIINEDL